METGQKQVTCQKINLIAIKDLGGTTVEFACCL